MTTLVLQTCVIHSWINSFDAFLKYHISLSLNRPWLTWLRDHICFSWSVFSFLCSSLQASILLLTSFVLLFLPFAFLLYNSLFSFTYLCLCVASKNSCLSFFLFLSITMRFLTARSDIFNSFPLLSLPFSWLFSLLASSLLCLGSWKKMVQLVIMLCGVSSSLRAWHLTPSWDL